MHIVCDGCIHDIRTHRSYNVFTVHNARIFQMEYKYITDIEAMAYLFVYKRITIVIIDCLIYEIIRPIDDSTTTAIL